VWRKGSQIRIKVAVATLLLFLHSRNGFIEPGIPARNGIRGFASVTSCFLYHRKLSNRTNIWRTRRELIPTLIFISQFFIDFETLSVDHIIERRTSIIPPRVVVIIHKRAFITLARLQGAGIITGGFPSVSRIAESRFEITLLDGEITNRTYHLRLLP